MLAALGRGCPRLEEAHIGPGASLAGVGPLVRGCQELRLLSDVGEPTLDLAQVPCMVCSHAMHHVCLYTTAPW